MDRGPRGQVMGRFANGGRMAAFAYFAAALILVINGVLVVQFVADPSSPLPQGWGTYAAAGAVVVLDGRREGVGEATRLGVVRNHRAARGNPV